MQYKIVLIPLNILQFPSIVQLVSKLVNNPIINTAVKTPIANLELHPEEIMMTLLNNNATNIYIYY